MQNVLNTEVLRTEKSEKLRSCKARQTRNSISPADPCSIHRANSRKVGHAGRREGFRGGCFAGSLRRSATS